MSTLRNKVQLIGNVGQDPTITDLDKGKRVARFTMATNEHYKNSAGERLTNTEWHTVIAWGKLADIIEGFVTKGKEVAIEGKLTSRSYEDKEGNKKYVTEVVASEILLLGGGENNTTE
ncbi:single-stranded DNA-binding protein [Flagellimonas amoyensis]|uniref:single-stranded DNA-binding protein n=1 Tax=Flagellimonas amoyensis TaxID=2169401 RepID=UPI000D3C29FA|nr:single-stranded DNA-binding protein [Allomuricauda amoyensis]